MYYIYRLLLLFCIMSALDFFHILTIKTVDEVLVVLVHWPIILGGVLIWTGLSFFMEKWKSDND